MKGRLELHILCLYMFYKNPNRFRGIAVQSYHAAISMYLGVTFGKGYSQNG